jgi:galactosylceramidase
MALAGMGLAASVLLGASEIMLDGSLPGGAYEGLGGLSAGGGTRLLADYPATQKSQILDLLFKPKFGASLQHLKIENGSDAESTFGTEPAMMRTQQEDERATAALNSPNPNDVQYADVKAMFSRGYEFWLAAEGRKRNPKLLLDSLQWGAPGWIGNGVFYSRDNAEYLAHFIKGAKAYWNLDFDFVGGDQNEAYNPGDWVKTLRETLDAAGLARVKINVVDLYDDELTKFERALNADVELQRATYAIGSHYVIEWWKEGHFLNLIESDATRSQHAQHLWIGEDTAQAWKVANAAGLYPFALYNAALFNRNHVLCKATMPGEYCFPVCAWLAAMDYTWNNDGFVNCYEPWSGHYEVTPSLWAVAHTTQFTAPGWIYLGGTGCGLLSGGGSYVTLRAPAPGKGGCDFSVVIETKDATNDQTLNFTLAGPLSRGLRHVWESFGTNDATWFTHPEGRLSAKRGDSFSITVRPNSIVTITTTTGQQKGTFKNIPRSVPFPATYSEDFERYSEHQTPKYLSDYYGAFEVTTDSDPAHNKCLQQQIASPVIKWFRLDDRNYTQTLIGDKDWKNYEVSVEAKMDSAGFVEIGARCVPHRDNQLIGPHLKVTIDGRWTLEDSDGAVLASGRVAGFKGADWHRYGLRCVGRAVAGSIDGAEKAVATTVQSRGAVYLATSRNLTKFDNLAIVPLSESGMR